MRYGRAPGAQAHRRRFERPKRPDIRRTERCRRPAQTKSCKGKIPLHSICLKKVWRNSVGVPESAYDMNSGCTLLLARVHALTSSLGCISFGKPFSPRCPQRLRPCTAATMPALTPCSRACLLENVRQADAGSSAKQCLLVSCNAACAAAFAHHCTGCSAETTACGGGGPPRGRWFPPQGRLALPRGPLAAVATLMSKA